jgi:hypothetical protein
LDLTGEITGGRRSLHNEEHNNLFSSPDIIRNACKTLTTKSDEKRLLGRPRCKWEDNIEMVHKHRV